MVDLNSKQDSVNVVSASGSAFVEGLNSTSVHCNQEQSCDGHHETDTHRSVTDWGSERVELLAALEESESGRIRAEEKFVKVKALLQVSLTAML